MASKKSGQIILVVLLASAVMITVALALSSQSISNVNISSQEQEYSRAFNAAEAGIEDLLSQNDGLVALPTAMAGAGITCTEADPCDIKDLTGTSVDIPYKFTFQEKGNTANGYEMSETVSNGDIVQLNLDSYANPPTTDELTVYWDSADMALELIFVYEDTGTVSVHKELVARGTTCLAGVSEPGSASDANPALERAYDSMYKVDDPNIMDSTLKFLRVRPLCNSATYLAFLPDQDAGANSFPVQSYEAHVESVSGLSVAALEAEQTAEEFLPSVFDFALYSGQDINL